MARRVANPTGDELGMVHKALNADATDRLIADGDAKMIVARGYTAMLYDKVPAVGVMPVENLREIKRELGNTAAMAVPDVAMEGVGHNLREARRRSGIRQVDAAKAVGISKSTLHRIESGRREPTMRETISLCTVYGVHLERVLGMIDSDEELLLDLYESASKSIRDRMIVLMQRAHDGDGNLITYIDADERQYAEHMRQRVSDLQGSSAAAD